MRRKKLSSRDLPDITKKPHGASACSILLADNKITKNIDPKSDCIDELLRDLPCSIPVSIADPTVSDLSDHPATSSRPLFHPNSSSKTPTAHSSGLPHPPVQAVHPPHHCQTTPLSPHSQHLVRSLVSEDNLSFLYVLLLGHHYAVARRVSG